MPLDCEDCGQTFGQTDCDGPCKLCRKRNEVDTSEYPSEAARAVAMDAITRLGQCRGCGMCYKYFTGTHCGRCNDLLKGKKPLANAVKYPKQNVQKENTAIMSDVIEIDNSDSDSDIQEISRAGTSALKDSINKHKAQASSIRLKTKGDTIPEKSRKFLKLKKDAATAAVNPAKSAQILFRCSIAIVRSDGRQIGTRVPVQQRGFPQMEILSVAFAKLVKMFGEADGQWAKEHPGKSLVIEGPNAVHFTIKTVNGGKGADTDIPAKWLERSVGEFWNHHASNPGAFFKPVDIAHSIANVIMRVPEETLVSEDEKGYVESDSEPPVNRKRKRSKQPSSWPVKREKISIKEEVAEDGSVRLLVKEEPRKIRLPSARSDSRRSVAPISSNRKTSLIRRQVLYHKYQCFGNQHQISIPETRVKGSLACTPVNSALMPRTFELDELHGDNRISYLARRMDGYSLEQLTAEQELASGHAELYRGSWLQEIISELLGCAAEHSVEIEDISSPNLFMALIQGEGPTKSKINSNLYICQPYINPVDVVPADEHQSILSALSHVSFVHSKGKRVLTDFSLAISNSNAEFTVFAPVTHSSTGDSGLGDDGPEGLTYFQSRHKCDNLCVALQLKRL